MENDQADAEHGMAEPILRNQIIRCEWGQGNINFPCSTADHEQDWQPYPVDPHSAIFSPMGVENEQAGSGRNGRTRPREIKLSGANGVSEI